jgi:hypothetical protein
LASQPVADFHVAAIFFGKRRRYLALWDQKHMAAHLDVPVPQDCLRAVLFAEVNPKRELKDGLLHVDRRTNSGTPPPIF